MSEEKKISVNNVEEKEKTEIEKDDLAVRDPRGINKHLKINFDDVIAESDPKSRSLDQVWKISTNIFEIVSTWTYRILSLLMALPFALLWGLIFAVLSFFSIWCCQPLMQTLHLLLTSLLQAYEKIVRSLLEPIGSSFGRCYENIRIHKVSGSPSEKTDEAV